MAESRASIVFGRWGFKTVRPYLTQLLVVVIITPILFFVNHAFRE